MKIIKDLTEVNYTKGNQKQNKYIVVHYTGNVGDTAKNNAVYFKYINRNASAHYFVDENEIYQVVEDDNIAWHCGANTYKHKYCRNSNSIGIEMCNMCDGNSKVEANTVQLIKELMDKYNIPIDNVLRHFDVTNKLCPKPYIDDTAWNTFKSLLTADKDKRYNSIDEAPEWARATLNKLIECKALANMDLSFDMIRVFVVIDRWLNNK